MRRKKYKYNIEPTTRNERIGKYFLKGLLYTGIFSAGIYIGHNYNVSKLKDYSINDIGKDTKKIEKKVEHKKDTSLDWLIDKINGFKK